MPILRLVIFLCLTVLTSAYSLAKVTIRPTSDNGQSGAVGSWKLLEYSQPKILTAKGVKVTATREVVCLATATATAGMCSYSNAPYAYLFIFQLQSTSSNVKVEIGNLLPGFAVAAIMQCDDDPESGNNQELCTHDTDPPSLSTLADAMTATPSKGKSPTSVTFEIPYFPAFPAGNPEDGGSTEEGQGLTIYVLINQTAPAPVDYPSIGVSSY